MNTLNLVLTIVLSTIIGFAIGNAYGQAKMKMIINDLIKKMTEGLRLFGDKKGENQ